MLLSGGGVMVLAIGAGGLLRRKLKRAGVSPKKNIAMIAAVQMLLVVVATAGLMWWTISFLQNRQQEEGIPYTVTSNGHTVTFTLYRDQLPLTLEDLGYKIDRDIYSYHLDQSASPVFSKLEGDQDSYASLEGKETWNLNYKVYRCCWSNPLDRLGEEWLERKDLLAWGESAAVEREDLAALWGAEEVWSDRGNQIMVRYPHVLLILQTGEDLTAEQVAIVRQKLELED